MEKLHENQFIVNELKRILKKNIRICSEVPSIF